MTLEADYTDIRDLVAKFSDVEVAPLAEQIDRNEEIPASLRQKCADNGFFGIFVPEELGGAGMDYLSYSILIEEIARGCASTGVLLSAHSSLCVWPILNFGTDEQKKQWLPELASGDKVGCFCLSEPNSGSDAGSIMTKAEDKGDYLLLNGVKNWITNGKEASTGVVFAKTKNIESHKGVSAFIVDMKSKGVAVQKCEEKLGIKGSSTAQIVFENVKVPKGNLLGKMEGGFKVAMMTLDGGRIGIAAQALGIARDAFDFALKYSTERVAFKQPICQFQMVQSMLADMSTKIAASKLLIEHASHLKSKGLPYTKEAAQAKLFAAEAAMWVTNKSVQVLGGNGYSKEYPVERNYRDAKITEIYEGTSEIQKIVISSQELRTVQA